MMPALYGMIEDAIKEAKASPPSREMSLVITKLEEALLWYKSQLK